MVWEISKYDEVAINQAGKNLINPELPITESLKAIEILENWRASHGYPMHIFQMTLKNKSLKFSKGKALVSQRLKRVPAILYKLNRVYSGNKPSIKLYKMQDIGGCRAVLENVDIARRLYQEGYLKGDLKHKLVNKKDYVTNPKPKDGYRSFHLVYAYKSDKGKKEYNGLLTEIQIRSKLQHLWATAVETAGFITRQLLKSNEGSEDWILFFKLISSAFARWESCPPIPNTPEDEKELYLEIKRLENELKFISKMERWSSAIQFMDEQFKTKKIKYFLLELDIVGKKTIIRTFTEKEEQRAIEEYSQLEKRFKGNKEYDVVLVGAENTNELKKAYPSYFLDISLFLNHLRRIITKYN